MKKGRVLGLVLVGAVGRAATWWQIKTVKTNDLPTAKSYLPAKASIAKTPKNDFSGEYW